MPAAALSPSAAHLARRFLSDDVRAKIQQAVTATPVVLFMKGTPDAPQCGFSRAAVQVLHIHGVPPEKMKTFDVLEDGELRSSIKEFSCVFCVLGFVEVLGVREADIGACSDWPTIPQLYVNGEFVGGCDILLNSTSLLPLRDITVTYRNGLQCISRESSTSCS